MKIQSLTSVIKKKLPPWQNNNTKCDCSENGSLFFNYWRKAWGYVFSTIVFFNVKFTKSFMAINNLFFLFSCLTAITVLKKYFKHKTINNKTCAERKKRG